MDTANFFATLTPGHSPQDAWARLHHDLRRGARHDQLGAGILARNGDLRAFAYPEGAYVARGSGTVSFVQWVLGTGVDLEPDPETTDIADEALAALVRGQPRLLATALAIRSQSQTPASPVGYIELPEPEPKHDPQQPRFAEAARYHEVLGQQGQRFYVFFGWVHDQYRHDARRDTWV
ncbi:MAG: hypothetical protein KKA73_18020 [Chloroflexi bacterium]|nr:hypothetical protein [Chloroflexota bacterium]MBU1749585.1 hypothetical protein [Chloroflexota bacterium]